MGLPRLSDKQKLNFMGWMRPYDICDNPKMVHLISSFSIKQVSACTCMTFKVGCCSIHHNVLYVRSWFCIVYEAAKPRVDYANQDLTILVPLIADPLTS